MYEKIELLGFSMTKRQRTLWIILGCVLGLLFLAGAIAEIIIPGFYGLSIPFLVSVIFVLFRKFRKFRYYLMMGVLLSVELVLAFLLYLFAVSAFWVYVAFATLFFVAMIVLFIISRFREKVKISSRKEVWEIYRKRAIWTVVVIIAFFVAVIIIRSGIMIFSNIR
jgi:O-antigen/teichoic acid export membrane protein